MIKELKKYQIKLTPFSTAKSWTLDNIGNDDLILCENDDSIALEFVDYGGGIADPYINISCSLALEQQEDDEIHYREGQKLTGTFHPDSDPMNVDGTYKRVVYSQIKTTFYNEYRDPTKMWGLEKIDFEDSETKKYLADSIKLFDVPQKVFGEKIIEKSVTLFDNTLDDFFSISDDGNGNLLASRNLFSRFQEVGEFYNIFRHGVNNLCSDYLNFDVPNSSSLSSSLHDSTPYVVLNWTNVGNEDGYVIERSVNSGSTFSLLSYVNKNVLTANDFTVAIGGNYWYRIYAYNTFGNSDYSNVVHEYIWNPPLAPSSLSASLIYNPINPYVYLTWIDNSSNESGFVIERSTNSGSSYAPLVFLASGSTSYSDTTVLAASGSTYWYRIYAYNAYTSSARSNDVSQSVWDPPAAPTSMLALLVDPSASYLSWTDNSDNEDWFVIQRAPGTSSAFTNLAVVSANTTSYLDLTTAEGNTYSFRVAAGNVYATSSWTATASLEILSDFLYDSSGSRYLAGPYDTFEKYTSGSVPDLVYGGFGWSGSWIFRTPSPPDLYVVVAEDDFTSYDGLSGSYATTASMTGGWGWAPADL